MKPYRIGALSWHGRIIRGVIRWSLWAILRPVPLNEDIQAVQLCLPSTHGTPSVHLALGNPAQAVTIVLLSRLTASRRRVRGVGLDEAWHRSTSTSSCTVPGNTAQTGLFDSSSLINAFTCAGAVAFTRFPSTSSTRACSCGRERVSDMRVVLGGDQRGSRGIPCTSHTCPPGKGPRNAPGAALTPRCTPQPPFHCWARPTRAVPACHVLPC